MAQNSLIYKSRAVRLGYEIAHYYETHPSLPWQTPLCKTDERFDGWRLCAMRLNAHEHSGDDKDLSTDANLISWQKRPQRRDRRLGRSWFASEKDHPPILVQGRAGGPITYGGDNRRGRWEQNPQHRTAAV